MFDEHSCFLKSYPGNISSGMFIPKHLYNIWVIWLSMSTLQLLKQIHKDLGISELKLSGFSELFNRLLPAPPPKENVDLTVCLRSSRWRTSHISTDSFFYNKHGTGLYNYQLQFTVMFIRCCFGF